MSLSHKFKSTSGAKSVDCLLLCQRIILDEVLSLSPEVEDIPVNLFMDLGNEKEEAIQRSLSILGHCQSDTVYIVEQGYS